MSSNTSRQCRADSTNISRASRLPNDVPINATVTISSTPLVTSKLEIGMNHVNGLPGSHNATAWQNVIDTSLDVATIGVVYVHNYGVIGPYNSAVRRDELLAGVPADPQTEWAWGPLDNKLDILINDMGYTEIAFCGLSAPAWMRMVGGTYDEWVADNRENDPEVDPRGIPEDNIPYFAQMMGEIAFRYKTMYPTVKFEKWYMWGEMKGTYVNVAGTQVETPGIEPEGLSNVVQYKWGKRLHAAVRDAILEHFPTALVAPPYIRIEGSGANDLYPSQYTQYTTYWTDTPLTARDAAAIDWYLDPTHTGGCTAIAYDRQIMNASEDELTYMPVSQRFEFAAMHQQLPEAIKLRPNYSNQPLWSTENYPALHQERSASYISTRLVSNPDLAIVENPQYQAAIIASMLYYEILGGVNFTSRWKPISLLGDPFRHSLWTSINQVGGGQPTPVFYVYKYINQNFAKDTVIYQVSISGDDRLRVLASATKVLLINEEPTSKTVSVDGTVVVLTGYEVKLVNR